VTIDDDGKVKKADDMNFAGVALYTTEAGEPMEILIDRGDSDGGERKWEFSTTQDWAISAGPPGEAKKNPLPDYALFGPRHTQAAKITHEFFKEHSPEAIACPCGLNMTPAHFGETFKVDLPFNTMKSHHFFGSHLAFDMPVGPPTFRASGACPECGARVNATWNHVGNLIQSEIEQRL